MKTKLLLAFLFAGLLLSCNNNAEPEEWITDTAAEVEAECEEADEYTAYDEFEYSSHSSSERDRQHQHNHQHQHDNNQNNNSQSYSQPRPEWTECIFCMGSGRCKWCGGTGWVWGGYDDYPCPNCQANQNGLCSNCAGRGLVRNY